VMAALAQACPGLGRRAPLLTVVAAAAATAALLHAAGL
jgi:hypothetical protein